MNKNITINLCIVLVLLIVLIVVCKKSLFIRSIFTSINYNVGSDENHLTSSITYGKNGYKMIIYGSGPMSEYLPVDWQNNLIDLGSGWKISIREVTVLGGVSSISSGAFVGCTKLSYVELPSSLTTIGAKAFSYCQNLTTIYYDGTIDNWTKLVGNSPLWNDESYISSVKCVDGQWEVPLW